MRLIKPSWVQHANDKNNKCPIYSLSVHPDGTRLATGGLDHKVKIWSTLPVLDESADDETNPKLLCTMTTHSGSVLAVRWAHHGRFLATGSDDQVVVIWALDPEAGGKLWGSEIVNVENWKPVTRLVGHTSDIIDVAWSRDDSMLASVGLDNSIWIWDGYTFDRIHRITGHEGFVKGVTWDPVGEFLATQSDDKSVRIWNTSDWSLHQKITAPFERSPSSTFFRRLSWSPDGAFIAASNAMNGPVFVGAVIERENFETEVSFVGHANTIQVAAFNPRLFFQPRTAIERATASTVLALGSNDFSISIWRNSLHKPLVVLKEVFGRNLMDLCWSQDGLHLYGCSEDGTICAVEFDAEEFPDRSDAESTDIILKTFSFKSKRQPRHVPKLQPVIQETSFGTITAQATSKVNTIQPRKNKAGDNRRLVSRPNTNQTISRNNPTPAKARDAFAAAPEQSSTAAGSSRADMLRDAPSRSDFGNGVNQLEARGSKRKAITLGDTSSGRNMASSRPRIVPEVRELRAPRVPASGGAGPSTGTLLGMPQIQSVLRAKSKEGTDEYYLEAENAGTPSGHNKVTFIEDGAEIWLDYLPAAILAMAISEHFCAVACEDGNLLLYSHAGRHLFSIKLESPCYDLSARGKYLFVVTTNCQARVYNIPAGTAVMSCSIAHLVEPDILDIDIRPNGTPVVINTDSSAYAYDSRLQSWVPICDNSYLQHDTGSSASRGIGGPLADIERQCRSSITNMANGKAAEPEWWDETHQMGLLDMRIKASVLLGSKDEYKHWLSQYATFVGEQEFTGRAEELLKELVGPLYSHPGRPATYDPEVLGLSKRELAMTVSTAMLRANQAMSGLVGRYQAILQAVKDEEGDI